MVKALGPTIRTQRQEAIRLIAKGGVAVTTFLGATALGIKAPRFRPLAAGLSFSALVLGGHVYWNRHFFEVPRESQPPIGKADAVVNFYRLLHVRTGTGFPVATDSDWKKVLSESWFPTAIYEFAQLLVETDAGYYEVRFDQWKEEIIVLKLNGSGAEKGIADLCKHLSPELVDRLNASLLPDHKKG